MPQIPWMATSQLRGSLCQCQCSSRIGALHQRPMQGGRGGHQRPVQLINCPLPTSRRRMGCVARAEETGASANDSGANEIDSKKAIRLAAERLESLLAGTGDGEVELITNAIREMPPENKAVGFLVAGSILGSAATLLCSFLGIDPWGGMDFSAGTLQAAVVGVVLSLPIMRLQDLKWREEDGERFPAMTAVRDGVKEANGPLMDGMTPIQLALVASSEALVRSIWEVAMVQGGFEALVEQLWKELSLGPPGLLATLLPLLLASFTRALSDAAEFEEDPKELEVIQAALQNCDRYYNVMNPDKSSADEMAAAFKAVAFVWFQQKRNAQVITFWTSAAEVAYVSLLWRLTGNLASPLVALLLAKSVDIVRMRQAAKSPTNNRGG